MLVILMPFKVKMVALRQWPELIAHLRLLFFLLSCSLGLGFDNTSKIKCLKKVVRAIFNQVIASLALA